MRRLIFLFLLLILLAAIAAGASVYFHVGPLADYVAAKMGPPQPPPPPPPPQMMEVTIGSFMVPLVQNHEIVRNVSLDLAISVEAPDFAKATASVLPLQNAFTLALYDIVPRHADAHSTADKQAIHDRLMKVADQIVGKGVVKEVVIKSFYDR